MLEKTQTYFFFSLLAIVALIAFVIALPYLPAIVFAAALAVVFRPLYERLLKSLRGRRLAAWVTIVLVAVIVFVPLTLIGIQVASEAHVLYDHISKNGLNGLPSGELLKNTLGRVIPSFTSDSQAIAEKTLNWFLGSAGFFVSHILTVFLNLFICVIALFYFLADGASVREWIVVFSPLPKQYDEMILDRLSRTVASVFRGTLVIALLQGVIAGIGFVIFGVPNPALWGTAAAIAALIPGVGTSLVLIPAILYALIFKDMPHAVGLAVWAFAAIGLVDNILGPRLMRRGAKIHPFVIFIAVLGGLAFFGPLGFIIGPLVFSLLFTLFDIYASIHELQGRQGI
jgi:predicted PurR-regulated permease PerM